MKIAINDRYGGFGLSALATEEIAKRKGKKLYFFNIGVGTEDKYTPMSAKDIDSDKVMIWIAYTVPNPQDYRLGERDEDGLYTSANKRAEEISFEIEDRSDKDMIAVIEEMGDKANSRFSKLKIVEIPDDVDWVIEEYDGIEWIAEKHQTWR